jgi:uncharacterized protein YecE (DUF72 family)
MPPRVRLGVIGWDYPEWRGLVYRKDARREDFLEDYALRFPIVEAASGQYGLPKRATCARWADATPDGFELSLKAPSWFLQKDPREEDFPRALDVLLEHVAPLAEKGRLGTIVLQFPPHYRREARAEHLESLTRALPPHVRWAVELRHASWWQPETYDALRESGVTLVWSDLGRGVRTPTVATTDALYLRLFGERDLEPPYDRKRRDARGDLGRWVERVESAPSNVRRVDVLVSKYLEGYAPATVDLLAEMLGVDARPAPPTRGQTTLPT